MKKPKAIIVDLDGTVCNIEHRLRFIKRAVPNWDLFNAACVDDKPIDATIELVQYLYAGGLHIILITGRNEVVMAETVTWLNRNHVPFLRLHMRDKNDRRPDHEIKAEVYDTEIKPIYDVIGVIEDRDQVVQMWRDKGLICYQCANGSY